MNDLTNHKIFCICLHISFWFVLRGYALQAAPGQKNSLPENLARKAKISADSEYGRDYQAKYVADGHIPAVNGNNDIRRAWCVNGSTHRNQSQLSFEWGKSVTVSEIVYYGRTAWQMKECWKGYEIFSANSESSPPILKKPY
ncbi:MAG: hypothetical protein ACYS6W_16890 [Planctomycetota bacterium]|jgi:hypothetical protein